MWIFEIIFWTVLAILVYTYIGYPLVLMWLRKDRSPATVSSDTDWPQVTHIIAAYNEEAIIADKVANCRSLEYPSNLIRTIIVADGSSDNTPMLLKGSPDVELLYDAARKGKAAALNRAVQHAGQEGILLFSDANSMLNPKALVNMMKHYGDPAVGAVAGEKRVIGGDDVTGKAESLYWRYESWLKEMESSFHTVVGAAGELFSMRAGLYSTLPADIILDDLFLSLDLCRKGWLIRYESSAFSTEQPSGSLKEEMERKIRISAGAFQVMTRMRELLSFPKFGKLAFQYISHRVLRAAVCPFALLPLLLINLLLVLNQPGSVYAILWWLQMIFYLLALLGALLSPTATGKWKLFYIPFYFLFMNISVWAGLARFVGGKQSPAWEKITRTVVR
jgi:cellulose synthase/poly-beta-1,6-N-acetylglucosamine synthase-like glycosyltransferase